MKRINEILDTNLDFEVTNLNDNSSNIKEGGVFFAIKGLTHDGNEFNEDAIKRGAIAIVTEEDINVSVPVIKVEDSQKAYNEALNKFYDNVRDGLKFISVTGTDGKTTTSEIIYQLLNRFVKAGYIGTNGIKCKDFTMENEHTTPFPDVLYKALYELKKRDCEYISLECSSERLYTRKVEGIHFEAAVFTNLTRDHLDTHKTMENYALAKAISFEYLNKDGLGVINYNDDYKKYFMDKCNGTYKTYSIDNENADLYASNVDVSYDKLEFDINGMFNKHIKTNLSGTFNVNNIMCAILVLTHLGFDIDKLVEYIEDLEPIDSRQLLIKSPLGFNVMVDYGHTQNAIKNLFEYVRPLTKGRIIGVYGAAGSRDPRRMIEVVKYITSAFDYNVLTIEDERYDDPDYLLKLMVSEASSDNYEMVKDRDDAIKRAINIAEKGDLVLIMGKGLEAYRVVKGDLVPRPNDYESALISLKELEEIKK